MSIASMQRMGRSMPSVRCRLRAPTAGSPANTMSSGCQSYSSPRRVSRSSSFERAWTWSRSTAASSKRRSAEARSISPCSSRTSTLRREPRQRRNRSTSRRYRSGPTRLAHGAVHWPIEWRRHGRNRRFAGSSDRIARSQVRNWNARCITVMALRRACTLVNGPKMRAPAKRSSDGLRVT